MTLGLCEHLSLSLRPAYKMNLQNVIAFTHCGEVEVGRPHARIFRQNTFYRAMHYSAKRGIAITCRLPVCLSVRL